MPQTRKYSRKREAILACLRRTDTHPTAEWIYQQLKGEIPDLSLGTVYRNLAQCKASGEVLSVGYFGGFERFDGNTRPHVHFYCTGCGRVLDLPQIDVPLELKAQAARALEAEVDQCSLTFAGRCCACRMQDAQS